MRKRLSLQLSLRGYNVKDNKIIERIILNEMVKTHL